MPLDRELAADLAREPFQIAPFHCPSDCIACQILGRVGLPPGLTSCQPSFFSSPIVGNGSTRARGGAESSTAAFDVRTQRHERRLALLARPLLPLSAFQWSHLRCSGHPVRVELTSASSQHHTFVGAASILPSPGLFVWSPRPLRVTRSLRLISGSPCPPRTPCRSSPGCHTTYPVVCLTRTSVPGSRVAGVARRRTWSVPPPPAGSPAPRSQPTAQRGGGGVY